MMRGRKAIASLCVMLAIFGAGLAAQSGPYRVEFTASPDHSLTDQGGEFIVAGYRLIVSNASGPVGTPADLGKPTPDASSNISVDVQSYIIALPVGTYTAVVEAYGPGGAAASAPSAPFSLTVVAPRAPGTPPTIMRSSGE